MNFWRNCVGWLPARWCSPMAWANRWRVRSVTMGGCDALERSGLTARERQILESIAAGNCNQRIAAELEIADATVKVHVKSLLKKLGLHSRVEAAIWCLGRGRRPGFAGGGARTSNE